ncbi:transporter substrate-binding domain-containing protein [Pseudomonas benzenivorans]|uniref:Transporter substrate-binding domain-containing protein n=1 Tax=Pseudomonas benzenivorans TaxID=556533 RepID=A0ABZ0Q0Q4_9PSED|nr:transporter substrate-binding domain-containing protein [Pseudomonas benzenivorans]WPC06551.1 transporter substrate-binding domain-containing protein [Pseudomonas benzenivorans]
MRLGLLPRLLTALLWLAALPAHAQAPVRDYDAIVESGVLRVAVYQDFAPYSFQQNGQGRGVDVELARALAEGLDLELELIWAPPGEKLDDDLRDYVWRGHYLRPHELADVMLRVPYDRDFAYMSNEFGELANDLVVMFGPYQRERWQLAHDRRRLAEVPSVAVFQQHPIGVEVDSVPSFYLSSVFDGLLSRQLHHYPNVRAAFAGMKQGEVDAVMALRGEIDWQLQQAADPRLALAQNAYPKMGKQVWDIGMAVHQSNRQLAYALEEQLEGLILDGRMKALYARYGLQYELPGLYQDIE